MWLRALALISTALLTGCSLPPPAAQLTPPARIRVALCQTEVGADPETNLQRIEAAIAAAGAAGAQLAVFAEAADFGWVNPRAHVAAASIPGATTERLARAARRHGIMVAGGICEKAGERLFNTAVLIDRNGELLGKHRKVNVLEELMSPPYSRGEGAGHSVFATRLGRIGLMICADTFEPDLVQQLASQGPELLVVPYGWAAPREAWPGHGKSLAARVAATARACRAPMVGVDSCGQLGFGPWKGFELGGQSVFADAEGRVQAVLADRRPEVRLVDVELQRGGGR